MKEIISNQIHRIAEKFLFAASLNRQKLHDIFEQLKDILKDEKMFTMYLKDPLAFSKKGLAKIRGFGLPVSPELTFRNFIREIDKAIQLAAKEGNEKDIQMLDQYVASAFRPNQSRWYNVHYRDMDYSTARNEAMKKVIEPMMIALAGTAVTHGTVPIRGAS
ncbi:MAG: hypothetical protein IMZ64_12425 [Bacteroidetes bacterium]|nr:hypothetical protein [Bacteroidota bacterium]